ncbi:UV excision repair protein Rad23 [Sistotremastrum suecicum HHB10207 ss-3]|uniref:UV excision repair protein RAD23 n=1 Tax=Sistotremastrum suecicum HHB10207 ss-3 TaxID=1314776 RepID=A0A166H6U8_9AGAM|nr:UV excision repair protein Rad23 [Sistotremastrum suecicum HHB10207 ss-3]
MKITIKTLQQKSFQIDADGTDTIADLKRKITESQGHSIESQKIIYSGKVLTDEKTVASCEIKEKDFLVLMVSKPKAKPAAASSAAPSTSVAASAPAPAPSVPEPANVPPTIPAVTPSETPAQGSSQAPEAAPQPQRAFSDTTSFLSGDALQSSINNMVDMGFARSDVIQALRASYNNPDRAVEYLMNGIPPELSAAAAEPATSAPAAAPIPAPETASNPAPEPLPQAAPATGPQNLFQLAQQQAQGGAAAQQPGAGAGAGSMAGFEALRNHPQFPRIRELVQNDPALLQPLIQQLAQSNPQFAQMINQNPEALFHLLGEGLGAEGAGEEGEALGALAGQEGIHTISVTPEEAAAIQRLQELGFPRQAVIEAYFACEKNEELAANYLFEGGFDDDAT